MSKKTKKNKISSDNIQKSENVKEKFNPKPWLIIFACILVVFGIAFLMYFFEDYHYVRKFTFDNGKLYDKKNDITYVEASLNYEPVRTSKLPYATDGDVDYYQIAYLDSNDKEQYISTSIMLAAKYANGLCKIYYNSAEQKLPEFKDFYPDSILVCRDNNTIQKLDSEDTELVTEHVATESKTQLNGFDYSFTLRFRSTKIPWMSYCLDLCISDGQYYIYNSTDRTAVILSEEIKSLFDSELLDLVS